MTFVALVWHAIQSVLTLLIIGLLGYVLAKKGWFSPEAKAMLPRLVIMVSLPMYMLHSVTTIMTRDELMHLAYGLIVPFLSIWLVFCLTLVLVKALKVPPGRRGAFCASITASNTVFIGLPVNIALFGMEAVPYVLLYYFANATFFWTVGNYIMSIDGEAGKAKICSLVTLKRVMSPPIIGFAVSLLLVLLGWQLPPFINNAAKYVGNMTTPLIIMFLGIMMQDANLRGIKLSRELVGIMLGRFVLSPLVIVLLTTIFVLPDLMRKVFIIQASLPIIASVSLMAGFYKSDAEFATVAVTLSTAMSVFITPVVMVLVSI